MVWSARGSNTTGRRCRTPGISVSRDARTENPDADDVDDEEAKAISNVCGMIDWFSRTMQRTCADEVRVRH